MLRQLEQQKRNYSIKLVEDNIKTIDSQDYEKIIKERNNNKALIYGSLFGLIGLGGLVIFIMVCKPSKQ